MTISRPQLLAMQDGPAKRAALAQLSVPRPVQYPPGMRAEERTTRKRGAVKASKREKARQRELLFPGTLEGRWLTRWLELGGPKPVLQHRFHPKRKWRLDFAIVEIKCGIEIDGGTWIRGGHSRGWGHRKDSEKANAAIELGWTIHRFTTDMVEGCVGFQELLEYVKSKMDSK